jgi:adenylate cyclase
MQGFTKAKVSAEPNNIEIERRFLVRRIPPNLTRYKRVELWSALFPLSGTEFFRARREGQEYTLTYKNGFGIRRLEMPVTIKKQDFDALWECSSDRWRSRKTRYSIPYGGKTIQLSIYHGALKGFANAEVELKKETERLSLPDWLGPEITNNRILTNNLGRNPDQVLGEARRLLRLSKT